MPKFSCVCGNVINLSQGVSDCEYSLVPERKIDEIGSMLSASVLSEDDFYMAIGSVSMTVYRCPVCDRLHLEEKTNCFSSYVKERMA